MNGIIGGLRFIGVKSTPLVYFVKGGRGALAISIFDQAAISSSNGLQKTSQGEIDTNPDAGWACGKDRLDRDADFGERRGGEERRGEARADYHQDLGNLWSRALAWVIGDEGRGTRCRLVESFGKKRIADWVMSGGLARFI